MHGFSLQKALTLFILSLAANTPWRFTEREAEFLDG